jgi:NAD(P)-dependent dehydrogenase (short-subunit alcohol dehydrogenase family)
MVLPFDLCGNSEELQKAAAEADEAFEGAGVDYLIHNAGGASTSIHQSL